jgi:uncharacterized protein (TIGR02246 family)
MLKLIIFLSLICAAPLQGQGNTGDWERPGPAAERAMYYAKVRTDVNKMLGQWRDAWQRDDAKAIGAFYMEDASYLPPGEAVHTRRAIVEYYKGFLSTVAGVEMQMLDFGTSGEMAFVTGRLVYFDPSASGGGRQVARTELMVLRRDSWGKWLIQTHMVRVEPVEKSVP